MARMGSPDRLPCCPVMGIDRKRLAKRPIDTIDPKRSMWSLSELLSA